MPSLPRKVRKGQEGIGAIVQGFQTWQSYTRAVFELHYMNPEAALIPMPPTPLASHLWRRSFWSL